MGKLDCFNFFSAGFTGKNTPSQVKELLELEKEKERRRREEEKAKAKKEEKEELNR
jgi:hypothetical protein